MSTDTKIAGNGELEVFEHEGGWAVRRGGEADALSHHETREQAEKAARLHSTDGLGVDLRQDIFANDPAQATRSRHTFIAAGLALLAVIALVVVLSLIVA